MTTPTSAQIWDLVLRCQKEALEMGHQITRVSSYAGRYEDFTKVLH